MFHEMHLKVHTTAFSTDAQQCHGAEQDGVRCDCHGQVMAFTHCSKATINSTKHRHQIKRREKNTTTYHHQGIKVCRKTFLFVHNIGEFRLKAIKAQYLAEGLVPRIHGHSGRIAPNALVLEHVQSIVTFVMQYAETNGILLPGRIPGCKRDDIQLLPSSTTKRAVWLLFQESTTSLSAVILHVLSGVEELPRSCCGLQTNVRSVCDLPEK